MIFVPFHSVLKAGDEVLIFHDSPLCPLRSWLRIGATKCQPYIWRLMWQTPRFFYLAQPCKHPFVLFGDRISFLCAAKLNHISMRTMKDEKRIRGVRPAPMLHVVSELLGSWHRSTHLVIRDVRGVVHHVGNVRGSYTVICIRIHISPEDGREHVRDAGSFWRFIIACLVTFLDDLL